MEEKSQIEKFIESSREHECDESEEAFFRQAKKLTEHKPKPETEVMEAKD